MATFGERIKKLRKEKSLTQEKLANILFIDNSSISKYEHNQTIPENELLQKIADFFDVSMDYLVGRSDNPSTSIINTKHNDKCVRIEVQGKAIALSNDEIQELVNTLSTVGFDVAKLLKKEN